MIWWMLLGITGLLWLGLGWLWCRAPAPVAAEAAPRQAPKIVRVIQVPSLEVQAAEAPEPSATAEAFSAAVGHSRIAAELGLVAVRCWVGTEFDGVELDGGEFGQRIEGGWYSNVLSTPKGRARVQSSIQLGADEQPGRSTWSREILFTVYWEAREGDAVECTVEWPKYAELSVEVRDEDGVAVGEANVHACGGSGHTDAEGRLELPVLAGQGICLVNASHLRRSLSSMQRLEPLVEHETRRVEIVLREASNPTLSREELRAFHLATIERGEERLAIYERLALSAVGREARLYGDVIERLEGRVAHLVEFEAQAEARLERD